MKERNVKATIVELLDIWTAEQTELTHRLCIYMEMASSIDCASTFHVSGQEADEWIHFLSVCVIKLGACLSIIKCIAGDFCRRSCHCYIFATDRRQFILYLICALLPQSEPEFWSWSRERWLHLEEIPRRALPAHHAHGCSPFETSSDHRCAQRRQREAFYRRSSCGYWQICLWILIIMAGRL